MVDVCALLVCTDTVVVLCVCGVRPHRGGRRENAPRHGRVFDRHSGTGRGKGMKRDGRGRANWGAEDEYVSL